MYYLWAVLLVLSNFAGWTLNLFALPGNWLVVLFTAIFVGFVPRTEEHGIGWWTVLIIAGVALLGEVIEFAAGAAGAAKKGGSRRGMVLAIVGTMIGSLFGAALFSPVVPVIGTVVGAVGGGGLGAFAGAYLGETWKGRAAEDRMEISRGALVGRLLGTVGKLAVGIVMVITVAVDAFV